MNEVFETECAIMIRPELLPHYTLADYRRWEGCWELVAGIPYAMVPSATVLHQRTALKIARQIDERLEQCDRCQVLQETDWIISEDTVVRPDVIVVCGQIQGHYPAITPKLILEIISPSTALNDEKLKFELYEREGVAFYVLVYPERKVAKIFRLENGRLVKEKDASTERHRFDLGAECTIEVDFARIWP